MYRGGRNGPPTPQQRQSAAALRDQLVADHLNGDPTAGQQVVLDLLTFAKIRHADCTTYLANMPRPWVDRRSHRAWTITHDLAKLERHIARLMLALVDPALERRLQPPEDLASYVARIDAEAEKNLTDLPAGNNPSNPDNPPEPLPTEAGE
jgi:hypothetical protein